jgi:Uma2 family endonuclease
VAFVADLEPLHRIGSAAYHRLVESGALADARVELIDGLLVEMSPKSRAHELAVEALTLWLSRALDPDRFRLRIAAPLSLADGTEPEPDVAVVRRGTPEPYHPARADLVIEVALSSHRRDLVVKAAAYAAAGVGAYLVCDLDRRIVVEHLTPLAGAYGTVREVPTLDARIAGVPALSAEGLFTAASR